MRRFKIARPLKLTVISMLTLSLTASSVLPGDLVELRLVRGKVDFSADGPSPFALIGRTADLGWFRCEGEIHFVPGEEEGTLIGAGVAVFRVANGDLLVGNVEWVVDKAEGAYATTALTFRWADSVEFSDGKVVDSTGVFVHSKPRGLVVIAIIAILIGLLLPAVQKVR